MQGSVEMLDFEESCLDTGNMSYRAVLGRMGHAAGPSLFCEWEIFGWWKCSLEFLLLVFHTSRKWSSCPCCSWYLTITKRQKNGRRDGWELEHMPYEDKLMELLSFTLMPWYLWEGYWGDEARLLNAMRDGKMRYNERKLQQKRFTLVIRGNFSYLRAVKQWSRLSIGVMQSLYSQFFKTQLAKALLLKLSLVELKVGLGPPKVPFSLNYCMITWFYEFFPCIFFVWSMNFETEPFSGLSSSTREVGSHRRATAPSHFSSAVDRAWRIQAGGPPATAQII